MTISLGRAVLELLTDNKAFNKGLDDASKELGVMGKTMASIGKAMAGAFAVTAIAGAVKSFTDLTGTLTDMAAKTGLSTTELQKLKYAAEQSGGSLEQVTGGIAQMGKRLIEGESGTVNALKRLGLNIEEIRRMEPGQAFSTIADSIAQIPSPMERSQLAMALFGKSGADLLPMMTGNFQELGDQAERTGLVLSEETVAAGDAFGDSLGTLLQAGMAVLGKVLTPFLPLLQKLAEWATVLAGVIGDVLGGALNVIFTLGQKLIDFWTKWIGKFLDFAKTIPGVSNAIENAAAAFDIIQDAAYDAGVAIGAIKPQSEKATTGMKGLKGGVDDVGTSTRESIRLQKEHEAALDKAAKAGVKAYKEFHTQLESVNATVSRLVHEHLVQVGEKARAEFEAGTEATIRMVGALVNGMPVIQGFGRELTNVGGILVEQVDIVPPKLIAVRDRMGELSQALAQLAQVAGGTFGTFASGLATVITAANAARKAIDTIRDGAKATGKLEGLLEMSSGIMGIVSAALAAYNGIRQIFSLFDRNKGRDLVEDFAETMGGFDALHEKLAELGDEGEALWVKLTQGVGRNNPEQARAAIKEVEEALARAAAAQEDATVATEEGAAATIETATQASLALDTLNEKIRDNESVWASWGAFVRGVLQSVADATAAIRVPVPAGGLEPMAAGGFGVVTRPTLFLAGEAGPEEVAFSGANRRFGWGTAGGVLELTSNLVVGDRVLAKSVERVQLDDLSHRERLRRY